MNTISNSMNYKRQLIQFLGCNAESFSGHKRLLISNADALNNAFIKTLEGLGLEVLSEYHQFPNRKNTGYGGATGVWFGKNTKKKQLAIVTIHTWPEFNKAASVDVRYDDIALGRELCKKINDVLKAASASRYELTFSKNNKLKLVGNYNNKGEPLGRHWIAVLNGCKIRPDSSTIHQYLKNCVKIVNAGELGYLGMDFNPPIKGVFGAGIKVISESHFELEVYNGSACFNFYTCNPRMNGLDTIKHIASKLEINARKIQLIEVERYSKGINQKELKNNG